MSKSREGWEAAIKRAAIFLFLPLCVNLVGETPKVPECFKIQSLTKADEAHYWAKWANTCPYTIDSVYVVVVFSDNVHHSLGTGVWGLHFVGPGLHRVTRFSTPAGVSDFEFVSVRRVTTDADEALH